MAVAFDSSSSVSAAGAGPHTVSHTCSGSDRLLVACIALYHSSSVVSALTYNGVALTRLGNFSDFQYNSEIWYLVNPASGANTLSLTLSDPTFGMGLMGLSFTGVDQTTPMAGYVSGSGTSTTPSVVASSGTDEMVVDALCITHSGTLSVGADQTSRLNAISSAGTIKYAASTEPGVSSTTMSWSNSTSQGWVYSAGVIKPAGSSPSGHPARKRHAGIPYMSSPFNPRIW